MRAMFPLPPRRGSRIAALALLAAVATCVEDRVPTASDQAIPDSSSAAPLVSVPIAHSLLTQGTNVNNQKVYGTAPIAPAPNALITVAVLGHNSSSAPPSPTLTGGGMSAWTEVASVAFDGATPLKRLTIFRAMSGSPGSGPLTITFSATVSNSQWIVSQWDGVDVSGTNGAGAIVQTGSTRADGSSGLTVTLAPFGDANNVAYGVFGLRTSSSDVVTPGAGFTEIAEQPSGESTPATLQAQWGVNDNTIDATWASLNAAALGVEIKAGTGSGGGGGGGGGGVSASQSTVSASAASITAGIGTSTITVRVNDASGNPISGATVALAATGTGNTLTQPAGPTDAAGEASGTISSTVAGTKTISAKANGIDITQTATVTVRPGAVSGSQSTVVADPSVVGIRSPSAITVTAKDDYGNPISGLTAVLAATGMTAVTQPPDTTDANGTTTGSVSSMMEEVITVSATLNGTAVTQTATVEVVSHAAATITQTLLTSGNNAANQKVYTTAAIAPAPNALVTVAVLMRRSSGALTPAISGGGMAAWEMAASADFDTQGAPTKRLLVFRALSAAPGSGPVTITFSRSVSNVQWIVSQWQGVELAGTNGSGAIAQTGTVGSDGTTSLAVPLAPFTGANDVAYGLVGVARNGPIVTPGAGFTEIAEVSSGETSALQTEWAVNQAPVGASWTTSTRAAMIGLQIRAGTVHSEEPVTTVEVSPQTPTVVVGTTLQLTAIALDAGGEPLPGHPFTWSSNAPQYATVSSSGLVTGVAVGFATISATTEGVVGTSQVTVTATAAPVASVEVTPASTNLVVGGSVQLTATPKDASGQPLTGRAIAWTTSDGQVATVSTTGLVTGTGPGTATITATSEGQSGTSTISVSSGSQSAQVGQWSAVLPAPIVEVHLHLLYTGKVLAFGGSSAIAQVWDPVTGLFTAVPAPALVFCSGHSFLPDGRLLVTGGGTGNGRGHTNSDIFDPATDSWIVGPEMNYARWYPTNTTLPNGEVVTIAGADQNGSPVPIPEVWDGTSWRALTGASLTLPNYPRSFAAPDGRVFVAGPSAQSRWLNLSGTGSWSDGPRMNFGSRSYGSAVMYDVGKIMFVGGNSSPTNTAELIDLNQPSPQWSYTGSLSYARWNLNATVLPDGKVLVTGGVSGSRDNPALAVNQTELWDPATGTWMLMASSAPLLRGYHSTALLLPDGRVIHSGGGDGGGTIDNRNFEIYSPPYLFRGSRPEVTNATPGTVTYGQQLFLETAGAGSIAKVTLIAFGSVTHAFDQNQRLVPLSFAPAGGGVSVTLPSNRTIAPPGPYMLFLVNSNGVPSIGRIMILQ